MRYLGGWHLVMGEVSSNNWAADANIQDKPLGGGGFSL